MSGPLKGKRILLTREKAPSVAMARAIRALEGIPVILPVMKIIPAELSQGEWDIIRQSNDFDWIIFTSPNGVKTFMTHVNLLGIDITQIKIAAVGKKTAQTLHDYGVVVERIPEEFTAESLADMFIKNESKGTRILMPLGNLAKPHLEDQLQKAGFLTKRINIYKTVINDEVREDLIKLVNEQKIDVVTFASPSAIEFFLLMTRELDLIDFWHETVVACIGKVSANYARTRGIQPRIIPETFTAQSLIEAISEYYSAS
jgi:uroporphyrinogen-III synthase